MQLDFHYYATYCAASLAGYSNEESSEIAYAAQMVDCLTPTMLKKLKAPKEAATTQLQSELLDSQSDPFSVQYITRIWSSFHFLPYDLYAARRHRTRIYMNKYRLICKPNGALVKSTVDLAKGSTLQAAGIAMHVLADTWAHSGFAGTPSLVINNISGDISETFLNEFLVSEERKIKLHSNPAMTDDPESGNYVNSLFQNSEISIMNLGHGRIGHLPDYSFAVYSYMPAWGDYEIINKNNPAEYYNAFCQMVQALKVIRKSQPVMPGEDSTDAASLTGTLNDEYDSFELNTYAESIVAPYKDELMAILKRRRLNAEEGFKELCLKISGQVPADFDIAKYTGEYINASDEEKGETYLGKFIDAAIKHKMMVTESILMSGSLIAGIPMDVNEFGYKSVRKFIRQMRKKNSEKRAGQSKGDEQTGRR